MPYIPPETVSKAREMDLLTYLRNYETDELVHFGGSTYCIAPQKELSRPYAIARKPLSRRDGQ